MLFDEMDPQNSTPFEESRRPASCDKADRFFCASTVRQSPERLRKVIISPKFLRPMVFAVSTSMNSHTIWNRQTSKHAHHVRVSRKKNRFILLTGEEVFHL